MMRDSQNEQLAQLISEATDSAVARVAEVRGCSGGCIHHAEVVRLEDGREFFVKSGRHSEEMFAQEACGLKALREPAVLDVPEVVAAGMLDQSTACLVLEAIHSGPKQVDFWQQFGIGLAKLHQQATAKRFGWSGDNFLGSTRQPNDANEDWVEFFTECRLRYQLKLARNRGLGTPELFRLSERLMERLDRFLGTPADPPSLLHGDLWSGNYLVNAAGKPTIIDPAVYYGRREADLAMPLLFGGFNAAFFEAYQATWPLEEGWRDRVEIYKLYHLINHLNLFGSGYLESCLEIVRHFA